MNCEKGACSCGCTKKVVDRFEKMYPELAKYENVFDANKKRKVARTDLDISVRSCPRIPCRNVQPAVDDDDGHEPDPPHDEAAAKSAKGSRKHRQRCQEPNH